MAEEIAHEFLDVAEWALLAIRESREHAIRAPDLQNLQAVVDAWAGEALKSGRPLDGMDQTKFCCPKVPKKEKKKRGLQESKAAGSGDPAPCRRS